MSKKCLAVFSALFFIFSFNASAKTANKSNPRLNESFVINALRQVQAAQMTYRESVGAGNFGTFYALRQANLIDAALGTLQKYGYNFSINVTNVSAAGSSFYSVTAVPLRYIKSGRRSFYIDESCRIRGADKNGAAANIDDPIIETCTPSIISDNERQVINSMRVIHSAQLMYQSTAGAGEFGTLADLFNAGLINNALAANFRRGYYFVLVSTHTTTQNPASFTYQARPEIYGRTGVKSFYIDKTGVIRGADRRGEYADQNDPPVEDGQAEKFSGID
jgi:hypothetical protein